VINGERAAMNGGEFRSTMIRTRNAMLVELTTKVQRKKRTASGTFAANIFSTLKVENRKSLPLRKSAPISN
jgi:hypothetical protein